MQLNQQFLTKFSALTLEKPKTLFGLNSPSFTLILKQKSKKCGFYLLPPREARSEFCGSAMAEKGFSVGKGSVPMNGNADVSSKSKNGRKVQFNDEGDLGKGGKGVNGGKSSAKKDAAKYELNVQSELPKNSQCVMDCEAAEILQGIQEQMVFLSRDPTIKLPVSFDKGLLYAKSGGRYSNPKTVRQVLETLKKYGVSDSEICIIANTCPENADEAFAIVPSLKAKRNKIREQLEDALSQLVKLKLSTEGL